MSANDTTQVDNGDGTITYSFRCDIPIASYLLALAIGNLEYKSTGARTGVISEPGEDALDYYVKELEDLESFLDATEAWLTPYIWGKYTIIILPASFPFGGMENPLLTFASPTIIVGDKSQVYVATHEIAHSWTGNQVTCKDWSNMWLNEGFTVFEERKVTAILQNSTDFALREAQLGNVSLWIDIMGNGIDSTYSSLYPVMNGKNPDTSYSQLPYEKGFQFLTYLESLLPSQSDFQALIRKWILDHSLTSVTWEDFQKTWTDFVTATYDSGEAQSILAAVDWQSWIFKGGANPQWGETSFVTADGTSFENLADAYI
jgi:leukotriene-A4 hydrolase